MSGAPIKLLAAAAVLIAGAALAAQGGSAATTPTPAPEALPDLREEVPSSLKVMRVIRRGRTHWRIGFRSAVTNRGKGPLLIKGRRRSRRTKYLTAEQVVARTNGKTVTYRGVGRLYFERFSDHRHWHFFGFAHYQLRRPRSGRWLRHDLKRGFCLQDSYRVKGIRNPPEPIYDVGYTGDDCGRNQPRALKVDEGISVGWGDDYDPFLEGQQIDISGLHSGVYDLVHRSNTKRRIRESNYKNNAASVRFRLRWPGGFGAKPRIQILKRCPRRARC